MGRKKVSITLPCGITVEGTSTKSGTHVRLNVFDLYMGCGDGNSLTLMGTAMIELSEMGFVNSGLYREVGYYESTNDAYFELHSNKQF